MVVVVAVAAWCWWGRRCCVWWWRVCVCVWRRRSWLRLWCVCVCVRAWVSKRVSVCVLVRVCVCVRARTLECVWVHARAHMRTLARDSPGRGPVKAQQVTPLTVRAGLSLPSATSYTNDCSKFTASEASRRANANSEIGNAVSETRCGVTGSCPHKRKQLT